MIGILQLDGRGLEVKLISTFELKDSRHLCIFAVDPILDICNHQLSAADGSHSKGEFLPFFSG